MKIASKIVGDGTDKMKKEVDRKGTLWGDFFRGAFAIAMFKRFVNLLRQGTDELKRTGAAGATAAAEGIAKYDEAINKLSATLATHLAPKLGEAADAMSNTMDHAINLVDAFRKSNLGRHLRLDVALKRRDTEGQKAGDDLRMEAERANIRKIRMAVEKKMLEDRNALIKDYKRQIEAAQTPIEKWAATINKLKEDEAKGIFKDMPGAMEKLTKIATSDLQKALSLEGMPKTGFVAYEAEIARLNKAMQTIPAGLVDFAPALDKAFAGLMDDLGFVFEAANKDDPFAKWTESMAKFHELTKKVNITAERGEQIQKGINDRLRQSVLEIEKSPLDLYNEKAKALMNAFHNDAIKHHELVQQTGQALMNLAATQDKISEQSNKAPEALIRGTAAAFSAANEFMRSREKSGASLDPQKLLADLAKKDAEKQAEQIRIGKAQLDELRKKTVVEWVNQ